MEPGATGGSSFHRGNRTLLPDAEDESRLIQHRSLPLVCVKQADPTVVLNDNNSMVVISHRLQEESAPPLEQGMVVGQLVLADALIIGNCNNQVEILYSCFLKPL